MEFKQLITIQITIYFTQWHYQVICKNIVNYIKGNKLKHYAVHRDQRLLETNLSTMAFHSGKHGSREKTGLTKTTKNIYVKKLNPQTI